MINSPQKRPYASRSSTYNTPISSNIKIPTYRKFVIVHLSTYFFVRSWVFRFEKKCMTRCVGKSGTIFYHWRAAVIFMTFWTKWHRDRTHKLTKFYSPDLEVNPNGGNKRRIERIISKSKYYAGFTDSAVTNEKEFEEQVKILRHIYRSLRYTSVADFIERSGYIPRDVNRNRNMRKGKEIRNGKIASPAKPTHTRYKSSVLSGSVLKVASQLLKGKTTRQKTKTVKC